MVDPTLATRATATTLTIHTAAKTRFLCSRFMPSMYPHLATCAVLYCTSSDAPCQDLVVPSRRLPRDAFSRLN
jgi:hypothetical protein